MEDSQVPQRQKLVDLKQVFVGEVQQVLDPRKQQADLQTLRESLMQEP